MVTKNPSKQRKRRTEAPLHILRKSISGHLSKELRAKYKARSVTLRKGDLVMVLGGKHDKKQGKVTSVNTRKEYINVEGLQINKKDGKTISVKIEPSNVIILELYKDDEKRFKHIKAK